MLEIKELTAELEQEYEALLQKSPLASFFHSLKYRDLLKNVLDAKPYYLCGLLNGNLVAVLPFFSAPGKYGSVVNSLPFFGSHGGVVSEKNLEQDILDELIIELQKFCKKKEVISCTLIESYWEKDNEKYNIFGADFREQRIGQVTYLPKICDKKGSLVDSLFSIFHSKTRNLVRKGLKGKFTVSHDGSKETVRILHKLHMENMLKIGGKPKPLKFYKEIKKIFHYDQEYRIYLAKKKGQVVSALLVFYYKNTVEYFTPTVMQEYRSEQPLSLLIFEAMLDAVKERGAIYWNWGGTWLTQKVVYHFKSRWGAKDHIYNYHIKTFKDFNFNGIGQKDLEDAYPYFFTLPFTVLKSK